MSDYIIIGGGLAGLSAAAYLSSQGRKVELLEASQKLGGRAYSFSDKSTGITVDNGQHIMMGCYRETLDFFRLIGAQDNLIYQDGLEVNFVLPHYQVVPVRSVSGFYPFNLAAGLMKYKALSFRERISLLRFFLKLPLVSDNDLRRLTVYDWLEQENQNERIRKAFWEILAVGTLNTSIYRASAKVFRDILLEIFFKGNRSTTIILPKHGLTETYCNNARKYIGDHDGMIRMGEQVNKLLSEDGRIRTIITNKRIIKDFRYVISAVPYYGLERILPDNKNIPDPGLKYSSILSIHIRLKENKLEKPFYGLIDSDIHWLFNHKTHITLVRSDADELMDKDKEELSALIRKELFRYFFIEAGDITDYLIIKEKRATFIPSNEINDKRPDTVTGISNLRLAGDWVETGLPSTIESAVKSGRVAAESLL